VQFSDFYSETVIKVQQHKTTPKPQTASLNQNNKFKQACKSDKSALQHLHTHTHTYAAVRRALWQLLTCDTAAQISRQRKRNQLLPHLCAGVWVCVSSGVTTYSKMSFACSFCCHCWRLTTTANTLTLEALIMEIKNLANM